MGTERMAPEEEADWLATELVVPVDGAWRLEEQGTEPELGPATGAAAQFATSNGAFGLCGWSEQPTIASWPRTFIAGLFDGPAGGQALPALVPGPQWWLQVLGDDGLLRVDADASVSRRRTLDYRRGVLVSDWQTSDPAGRTVHLRTLRFASLADRALAVQMTQVWVGQPTPVTLEARFELPDGALEPLPAAGRGLVFAGTVRSGRSLAVASTTVLQLDGHRLREHGGTDKGTQRWSWLASADRPAIFVRIVALVRGDAERDPRRAAVSALRRARRGALPRLLAAHAQAWASRWAASDISVDGDAPAQEALRFAVYHLVGAANPEDEWASIGARGLTGEVYHGHVFWDTEIFLLPFYTLTWPAAARALLLYRYHTLPAARAKAARLGFRGALYAWESTDTGEEATPRAAVGRDGQVIEIRCGIDEQHVSADIAYAVWQYGQATGDDGFFLEAGAEIVLETARFWGSRASLEGDGQYHIRGVIGPDEYHEGVDDNAYTNGMAQWNLERGLEVVELLESRWPDRWAFLRPVLGLTPEELTHWRDVADRLVTGLDPATGLIEQFAGYFALEEIDLTAYASRTAPMDVVLGRERTQRSQVTKQADVLMLLAVLGERFGPAVRAVNFRYYEPRCGHGSSLSPSVHALLAAQLGDAELAQRYFGQAAAIDLDNSMGNSAGGVHMATLGGLWQAAVFGFAGLRLCTDGLRFEPHLPDSWRALRFRIQWRGRQLRVDLQREAQLLTAVLEQGDPMMLYVGGHGHAVSTQHAWTSHWDQPRSRSWGRGANWLGA